MPRISLVWTLTLVMLLSAESSWAQPTLTLRSADRAIDRAFQAELAGDYEGARVALQKRIDAALAPEEGPGRTRLSDWLQGLTDRESTFRSTGKTAEGYHKAFRTLRPFAYRLSMLFWRRALRDLPSLGAEFERNRRLLVRFERVSGMRDVSYIEKHLAARLAREGLGTVSQVSRARYEVRIFLDAADADDLMNRSRVTVEASYVLRDDATDPRLIGSFAKRRSVIRKSEGTARRFGVRRMVDDIAWSLSFQLREETLRLLASP